jgi:thiol-disulfide isomerase/thioredoxin
MAVTIATDADLSTILSRNDAVVVKYFADWCGSCKLFAPKYRRLSDDPRFAGVVFLDIDAERNPEARHLAKVDNLPFFATFKNGQLVDGHATAKEENVVAMIEKVVL